MHLCGRTPVWAHLCVAFYGKGVRIVPLFSERALAKLDAADGADGQRTVSGPVITRYREFNAESADYVPEDSDAGWCEALAEADAEFAFNAGNGTG